MDKAWKKYRVFITFWLQNKFIILASVLAIVCNNVLNVLLPLSIGWFYEIALGDYGTKSRILENIPLEITQINHFYMIFGSLIITKGAFVFLEKLLKGIIGERFSRDLRERVFGSQLRHTLGVHRLRPVGKYLLRYSGDLLAIQQLVTKGILGFIGDFIFLITAFIVLFLINYSLAFIVLTIMIISILIVFAFSKQVRIAAVDRRNQRSKNLGFVSSRMNAFYTIKSFNREKPEENSFIQRSRKLYNLGVRFVSLSAILQSFLPVFFFSTVFVIFYYSASFAYTQQNKISNADVFVFILLLLYMQSSVKRLLRVNLIWQVGIISLDKLIVLLNLPKETRLEKEMPTEFNGNIAFEKVSFSFDGTKKILNEVSFTLKPGTITLLKGKQGSGKSTVIKLIQKLYEADAGRILFDNQPYADITAFEIRKNVTLVSSEVPLLGGTVFKAVSYSTSEDKREKVKKMLQKLKIELTTGEEENLDFKLDDNGRNISEGNRWLLLFARAFLTSKKVLLLDDPFSALDSDARQTVVNELNRMKSKRVILVTGESFPEELIPDQVIYLN